MNRKAIVIACIVLAAAAALYLLTRDRDEQRIRKNLALLADTVTKPGEGIGEIPLMGRTRTVQSLFTDDCTISVGRPVPDVTGIQQLTTVYFQAMRMTDAIEVTFHDVSVAIGDDGVSATTTMTAKATRAKDRAIEAREVELTWKKLEGKWRIHRAESVRVLR